MNKNPLVFVHGWATDSQVWGSIPEEIAVGGDYLNINLPGHGGNRSWKEPSLTPAVEELLTRIPALGGRKAIGVGWSLGAEALISYALLRKEYLRGLILVGATPCFVAKEGFPWAQPRALVKRIILDMKKSPEEALERFYPLNFTDKEMKTPEAAGFIKKYRYPGPIDCSGPVPGCLPIFKYGEITSALEALCNTDLRMRLHKIDCPVLLIHGELDAICPAGAAGYMAENINGSRLAVIKGAGHAPFITQKEAFKETIERFLVEDITD